MNQTLDLLLNRRTYRNFKQYDMPKQDLQQILLASKQAPSSMNIQYYSIIVVDDQNLKDKIYELSPRNPQIKECSVFLLYVMDFHRSYLASQKYERQFSIENNQDAIFMGSIDASLAMQNAIIAASALSYQTCCIGGVRMLEQQLTTLLNLPDYVYPVCGLCIGKSKDLNANKVKPRYGKNVFINEYDVDQNDAIVAYDEVMLQFAEQRETLVWSDKVANQYTQPNTKINQFLKNKKF